MSYFEYKLHVCIFKALVRFIVKILFRMINRKISNSNIKSKYKCSFYNILLKHPMKSSLIATFFGLVAANGAVTTTSTPLTATATKYTTTSSTSGGKLIGGSSYTSSAVAGGGESRGTTNGLISGLLSNNGISSGGASGSSLRYSSGGYSSGSGYSFGGGAGGYGSGVGAGSATSSSEYGLSGGLGAVITTTNGPVPGGVAVNGANVGGSNVYVVGGPRPPLDQYPKADLTNFYYTSANPAEVNSNVNSFRVINQANQNILTPNKSLDSIFIRFPSCSELDRLIISADTAALLRTIQVIATDNTVSCDQRITYLLQLLGRLKTAIEKKVFAADQLKIVIDASVTEIGRLQAEVENNKKLIANLGIDKLKDKQNIELVKLEEGYAKLNEVEGQTPVLQAQVIGIQKQIEILIKNSEGERNRISNDKLKLIEIVNQINNLQARLKELQDKQSSLNSSIAKSQAKIAENDKNVGTLRIKVEEIEIQVRRLQDESDRINSQVRDLEVKVERLRTDIAVAETKKTRYLREINNLDDKINIEKKKAVQDDLQKINEMVGTLRGLVPTVEGAIDRHYYNCYGDGNTVKIEQNGNVVVYIVNGDKFGDYLRKLYGQSVQVPSIRSDVTFSKVNIFGPEWTGAFGYPFVDSAFGANDFSFTGSFNCMNPQSVITGYGTISGIGSNYIDAQDEQGGSRRFSLGSCSRLESTGRVPKIGQKFYWSGVSAGQGFNLYGASCFD